MRKQKLVVLSGAGISAESGIPTFRDSNGLWEGHDVTKVATPEGWQENPELVLDFYNKRRIAAKKAQPNKGHLKLAELEQYFDVTIITQNVDDLHERAGSSKVIHLHGELNKSRSCFDENLIYDVPDGIIRLGDLCEKGYQLRPHIVWFGELVPMMENAIEETQKADIFLVTGTSLLVYPAAGLIDYVPYDSPVFVVDPNVPASSFSRNVTVLQEKATTGIEKVSEIVTKNFL